MELAVDLGCIFSDISGLENVRDISEAHLILATSMPREELLSDYNKELKKLAKRMAKAVQQPLREALFREVELSGDPDEKRLQDMRHVPDKEMNERAPQHVRLLLEMLRSEGTALEESLHGDHSDGGEKPVPAHSEAPAGDDSGRREDKREDLVATNGARRPLRPMIVLEAEKEAQPNEEVGEAGALDAGSDKLNESSHFVSLGGTPWYLEHFAPLGTSLQEEKWFGPDVVRGMSEELSEMDDEELRGLGQSSEADVAHEAREPSLRPLRKTRRQR